MTRSVFRANHAHRLTCGILLTSLTIGQGCAKLGKRHKHSEPVFGTYPASASQHAGLASVNPGIAHTSGGTGIYEGIAQPDLIMVPPSQPVSPSQTLTESNSTTVESTGDQVPKVVDVKPMPPVSSSAAIKPDSPAPVIPSPTADLPPANNVPPPVINPPANPVLPADLPPAGNLPVSPPAELPPPLDLPKSTGLMPPAGNSPFSNPKPTQIAENSGTNAPVLTLSLPGESSPPPAPNASELQTTPANIDFPTPVMAPSPPANTSGGVISPDTVSAVIKMEQILERANATLAQTANYQVDVSLQEQINGNLLPADKFQLRKRREPFAVRMVWNQGKDAGREVLFSPVETKGMIQIRMPKALIPRISMSPDSPLVRSKSRHPITEAGADSVVTRLATTLALLKSGKQNTGELKVERIDDPQLGLLDRITHRTVEGELWVADLDGKTGLPVTIHGIESDGQLIEHYEFRNYQLNISELLAVEAFNPDALWGQNRLFGRIARGTSDSSAK